jgi:hypothetical protein
LPSTAVAGCKEVASAGLAAECSATQQGFVSLGYCK